MAQNSAARSVPHRHNRTAQPVEGMTMTLIDTLPAHRTHRRPMTIEPRVLHGTPSPVQGRPAQRRRRPSTVRPGGAALAHRGSGVLVSRAPHRRRRPITPLATVGLGVLAALITVWLGAVAQFGAAVQGATVPGPSKLAVVQVQTGETLQTVAQRIAPDLPVGQTVQRIRELNELDSVAVDAGQTLIAPIG